MHFSTATAVGLLGLAASASASFITVRNNCPNTVYITRTNSQQQTTGPDGLSAGGSFTTQIVGTGNSLGLTTNTDYYSPNTAKLILGTSTSNGILYWSVSDVDGNPFQDQGFSITTPSGNNQNVCSSANSPDGQVHGCPDSNVNLILTAC